MEDHLTIANPQLQPLVDATPPGMMHWSGTGPHGTTCEGCKFFQPRKDRETKEISGRCREYRRIMRGRHGSAPVMEFPPETASCRHFIVKPPKLPEGKIIQS
jgi:hypothetical protein